MLSFRPLHRESPDDRAAVTRVLLAAPTYAWQVEGRAPRAEDADDFFDGRPDGTDLDDKCTLGFLDGSTLIGCADLIRAWPAPDCAWLGLLLFAEAHQGRGHGSAALALLLEMVRGWGCTRLQLAAVASNPGALAFWRRMGFDEVRRACNPRFAAELVVMERAVRPAFLQ